MMTNAMVADPRDTGVTLLIIAVGIPAYAVWKWLDHWRRAKASD
jgi:hypothetical protein